jgi:hypothetical protein
VFVSRFEWGPPENISKEGNKKKREEIMGNLKKEGIQEKR